MTHMKTNEVIPIDDCRSLELHPDAVAAARQRLGSAPSPARVASLFALLADPSRARLLIALGEVELCVCDLAAAAGMNRTTVSHQLRTLREGGILRRRRAGKTVYHALADDHVRELLAMGIAHAAEDLPVQHASDHEAAEQRRA